MPFQSKCLDVAIPDVSLYHFLVERIREGKDDVALIEYYSGGKSIAFKEIDEYSQNCAGFLHKQGLKTGDFVGVCANICVEYPVIILGILACGATVVFCNPTYSKNEVLQQFIISKPKMVFVDKEALETIKLVQAELSCIKQIVTIGESELLNFKEAIKSEHVKDFPTDVHINPAEDIALLPYSSGTTGLPKAVMLTHRNMVAYLAINTTIKPNKNDTVYIDRPIYHAGGFSILFLALAGTTKHVCNDKDDVEDMLRAIEIYNVTKIFVPPSFMVRCAESDITEKYNTSSLKNILFAGAATAPSVVSKMKKKFNAQMIEAYGSTETQLTTMNDDYACFPKSVGTLLSNVSAKIVELQTGREQPINESGEILVKCPTVLKGYLNNEEANRKSFTGDGWFRTGDVGYFDKDERLYIVDRIKEVIKYKSLQISPTELESVISKLPEVTDVGVVGIQTGHDDEVPKAFVVRKDDSLSANQIHAFVQVELADFKQLRGGIEFVESIPKSDTGKIQRRKLKEMAGIVKL